MIWAARNIKRRRGKFACHFASMEGRDFLCLLRDIGRGLDDDLSLEALATRAGWSRFHLHRTFRRLAAETPKQHTQRLRLTRAAARPVATNCR